MRYIVSILLLCLATPSLLRGQEVSYIMLKQEKIHYVPATFSIDSVGKSKGVKDTIGIINMGRGKNKMMEMKDGIAASFNEYVMHNLDQDKSKTPVTLLISGINVTVSKTGGRWVSDFTISFAYYAGTTRLVESGYKGHQAAAALSTDNIESFMRHSLEESLKKFDSWWGEHKNKVSIDTGATINVKIATSTEKENFIVYNSNKPLQVADFKGEYTDNHGPEMAMTNSGMGMDIKSEVSEGHTIVNVVLIPYFSTTGSWFKPEGRTSERLPAHEQTHFDITAIKTCELAAAIRAASFTKNNFSELLQKMQLQNSEDAKKEEDTYDNETNHGLILDKQLEWEQKVKEKIKEGGCFK